MLKAKMTRLLSLLLILIFVFLTFSGCVTLGKRNPIATMVFSNGAEVRIRLYPDKAPNTVANFIYLANSGYYNGTPVHRIVEYFVVQMGKPAGDSGDSTAGYYIKGEFSNNNFSKNDLKHEKGIVSMARTVGDPENAKDYYNSASSQFFITLGTKTQLDGDYAAFGKVISGMSDVEKISKMDVDAEDHPRDEIYVVSVTVDTFGKDYGEPKRIYP